MISRRARCFGSQVLLRQVLINLLLNAARFTKAGAVTLECEVIELDTQDQDDEESAPMLSAEAAGCAVTFRVRDTGCGMPPEVMADLFQQFATRGGNGVGLACAQKIIQAHGAVIQATSPCVDPSMGSQAATDAGVGPGSEFRFHLVCMYPHTDVRLAPVTYLTTYPARPPSPSSPGGFGAHSRGPPAETSAMAPSEMSSVRNCEVPPSHRPPLPPQPLRVLVADDLKINREVVMRGLCKTPAATVRTYACTFVQAATAADVVRLVQSEGEGFDLILLDDYFGHGQLTGTEVAKQLRAEDHNDVTIVLCTGESLTEGELADKLRGGIDDVFGKPLPNPHDGSLHQRVSRALRARSATG